MSKARSHRLPPHVRPDLVRVHIEVDPAKSKRYRGEVEIEVILDQPTRSIDLNAADLRISRSEIVVDAQTQRATLSGDAKLERIRLSLREPIPAGRATLKLAFQGALRGDLRGLYAASSGKSRYAFTQLEAADARRFFPCFDEPTMKARFQISVTTAASHTVLSNAPEAKTTQLKAGKKRVDFRVTPPLSSYLVALAVGELEGSRTVRLGKTPIRVWHVPGKEHLTAFGLEAAYETLKRLEAYFDLPYPYEKLDLVAVPDFEAGAMENAGAVFFRETLLLVDPKTVTQYEKKRVAEVICHELAHMWYGDLVTMEWWNDLWLNEAFATWMAFQIVADWKPEWNMWLDFQHHRAAALNLDALANTHPIYVDVHTPAEATENFDLITYEKGASVVRMIERYLGAANFRKGVRRYIRRHRESNTVAADLWSALAEAAGQEVEPVVRGWIEQAGFPLVKLRRETKLGRTTLRVGQERFYARKPSGRKRSTKWPVPLVVRVGGTRKGSSKLERHLLTKMNDRISLGRGTPRFVYANAEAGGFYRSLHDATELKTLAAELTSLSDLERMALVSDQWALVRADRAAIDSFLELAGAYGEEENPDVLISLKGPLAFVNDELAPAAGDDVADAFRVWLIERFGQQLLELGWDGKRGEDEDTRVRRATIISLLGEIAEWDPVLLAAGPRCDAYLEDRTSLDANLADPVVTLAARAGDAALYRRFVEAQRKAETPQERRRFLMALGDFRHPRWIDRTLALSLTNTVPTQDVAILLARMLGNAAARERTWTFIKRRWSALKKRMPPMLVTRVIDATPSLQKPKLKRDVSQFFRRHPIATGERSLKQAMERFTLNAGLRKRSTPALRRWAREL